MTRLDNDLISRNALLEAIKNNGTVSMSDATKVSECVYYDDVIDIITNAPTIESSEASSPKPWVELTDDEINILAYQSRNDVKGTELGHTTQEQYFARLISAKLKEVNHG